MNGLLILSVAGVERWEVILLRVGEESGVPQGETGQKIMDEWTAYGNEKETWYSAGLGVSLEEPQTETLSIRHP